MAFPKPSSGGSDFEKAPAGNHVARCYLIADLGMQATTYLGEEQLKRQILIGFELSNELMADGRPFAVSGIYTYSLNKKSRLRAILESWRGKPYAEEEIFDVDVADVIGRVCMVQVVHQMGSNGKTYTNIQSVTALPKGMTAPILDNPSVCYSPDDPDSARDWDRLPAWIQKKIQTRVIPSGNDSSAGTPGSLEFDDDIPF